MSLNVVSKAQEVDALVFVNEKSQLISHQNSLEIVIVIAIAKSLLTEIHVYHGESPWV
jgi:hypothetical protein